MVAFDAVAFDPVAFDAELPVGWVDLGEQTTIDAVSTAEGRIIASLTEWNGRIYLGYGDYQNNQPSAVNILSWNTATGAYASSLGTLGTNAAYDWRVIDDELWMVANDMASGTHQHYGVIDASHGYTDVNPGSQTNGHHLFDAIYFSGAPFVCGAGYIDGSCSTGSVWRYGGSSWSQVDTITPGTCNSTGYRTYGLFVIGSTLYAKPWAGTIRTTTDGTSWSNGSGMSSSQCIHPVSVDGGVVYRTGHGPFTSALKYYNGSSETTLESSGVISHEKGPDDLLYYLKGTSIYVSDDDDGDSYTELLDDAPTGASSLCVTADAIYVGTDDSHLWRIYT
jgi:hypothetical protein